jgi:hypothetical protein
MIIPEAPQSIMQIGPNLEVFAVALSDIYHSRIAPGVRKSFKWRTISKFMRCKTEGDLHIK